MADELVPYYLVAEYVFDNQQTKTAPPIGRVHVDDDILMSRNDANMAYRTQVTPLRTLVHAMLVRKLGKGLVALYVFPDK